MPTLNFYLVFNGNCREAMEYYKSILGGELTMMKAGDSPVASQMPPQFHEGILHSKLKTDAFTIMATDMTPEGFTQGNTVYLCLNCKTYDEAKDFFNKLSHEGKVNQPLAEMFFGLLGTCTDKFGKSWMVESDKP